MGSAQPVRRDITQSAALDERALASLACDVSFISDDSTPPERLIAQHIEQLSDASAAAILWTIFDRLRAACDAGQILAHRAAVAGLVRNAIGFDIDPQRFEAIVTFFDRVNHVMFQQQTLAWLVDSQFKVHVYGAGWEHNPPFARFARGTIDSDTMRLAIYRASRINLAASVCGALDNQVVEGISAGGFYLMRYTPADVIERIFPPLWDFCSAQNITTNEQLAERATPAIRTLIDFATRTLGVDLLDAYRDLPLTLRDAAGAGYTHSAAAVWPQYPQVSFSSRDELIGMVGRYLYDVPLRQRTADDMRRQLVGRFEHVRVNRRVVAPARSEVAA